ncbi:hypothetical protein [Rhodobacter sp. 24-YEA-8]|uniref:hypothetical protein n=1 Tax=Rhodobacter sp. 24-YEA-8 TaxID=1884310 RepID=UPI000897A56A|nr:hypothetical protein [Rhodobacter sp. 24-YEA-8]SEB80140.1 hypothetical protein SAMN05519105_1337 [Rhodobacter sp. 24-YEA-8]
MALKYDGTINAGAILQAVVVFAGALSAVIWTQAGIWRLEADQRRMETTLAADLASIRSDASAREVRIRAAELALAGQQSDLRSIQSGISRIEAQLEKLQLRP